MTTTTTTNPGTHAEAVELKIYGTCDGEIYRRNAKPVIEALARRIAAGTYDADLAPKAFAFWAEATAKAYAADAGGAVWHQMFDVAARREAARMALDYYADHISELGAELTRERANRKRWTLSAIRAANTDAGQFFFSPATMRFFGDTMKSWAVDYDGDSIFVVRVKPMRDRDGRVMGGVGARHAFDPQTGSVGPSVLD